MRDRRMDPGRTLRWRMVRRWLPAWYRDRYADALLVSHIDRVGGRGGARGWRFWAPLVADVWLTGWQVRIDARRERGTMFGGLEAIRQEFGLALRRVARRPGFAVTVVATLGLGIGANVMMFSILDRVLLSPPPGVRTAERVFRLTVYGRSPFTGELSYQPALSFPDYEQFRGVDAFAAVAGHGQLDLTLGQGMSSERVKAEYASASYFELLGVRPLLGRFYGDAEDGIGAEPVAVLSHAFWRRRFGADAGILGTQIELGAGRYTVVGVAEPAFTGVELTPTDVWIPLETGGGIEAGDQWRNAMGWYWFAGLVRMPEGTTLEAAEAAATARYRAARAERRGSDPDARVVLVSLIPGRGPDPSRESRVTAALGIVALLVLLIACANVINLLLARGIERRRAYAVQSALGMRRSRIIVQLLTETLVLAVLSGAVALLMAGLAGPVLMRVLLPGGSVLSTLGLRSIVATTLLVTFATLLVAALPSWRAGQVGVLDALRTRSESRSHSVLRRALLGTQAALSMLLLVGAGLFLRSLERAATRELGVARDVVTVTLETDASGAGADALNAQIAYTLLEELRADPAVESAALTSIPPFSGFWGLPVDLPGPDSFPGGANGPMFYAATGDYFRTLGMPIVRGRALTDADDRENAPPVAVVNEAMAEYAWPGRSPLGECLIIRTETETCTEVVGVVRDHLPSVTAAAPRQAFFLPPHHAGIGTVAARWFLLRPRGTPDSLVPIVRRLAHVRFPSVRYVDVGLLSDRVARQMDSWRLGATLLTLFGLLALVVAAAGFYGVVAFDVAQRRFELSVRTALGAPRLRLLGAVIGRAVLVTMAGVSFGLAGAAALGRFVEPLLFEVSPRDPLVYVTVSLTLLGAAALAGLSPALRATRSDPALAMREES